MQEQEIELKALLTEEQYEGIIKDTGNVEPFSQVNYYFDTEDFKLLNNKMALRIRVKGDSYKLTLKHTFNDEEHFVNEVSDVITQELFVEMIGNRMLTSTVIISYLNHLNIDLDKLVNLASFETHRIEKQYDNHVLFIDKNIFGNVVDYELEVEADDFESCQNAFNSYLEKYNLVRNTATKIKRAYDYMS